LVNSFVLQVQPSRATRGFIFLALALLIMPVSTSHGQTIVAPVVLTRVDAERPEGTWETAEPELFVTVDVNGIVEGVAIARSAGAAFDDAAIAAVKMWRFTPATRDGQPVPAKIRVPFVFQAIVPPPKSEPRPVSIAPVLPAPTEAPIEVTIQGDRSLRTESRSTGDFKIERDVLAAAPRQEGAEILRSAPGLYIGRGEGPAVAHRYMLRGFDSEHGQDIEFRVGGLPINLPSHLHGQGYADLGFLMAETVDSLSVKEGVSDPRQGDFAVAGSISVELGVDEARRGISARSTTGRFGTYRHSLLWAPKSESKETFGAAQVSGTDGFGQNRSGGSATAMFQHRMGQGATTFRLIGLAHSAQSDIAGVLRKDDIDSGKVCFLCTYPVATAEAQNASTQKMLVGFFTDHVGADGSNGQVGVWLGRDGFRMQSNFTGFIETSRTLPNTTGRGDLIEQENTALSMGLTGRYRGPSLRPASWLHGTIEVGSDARIDDIQQTQNLLDASVHNQTWDERVDAGIRSSDIGLWGDLDFSFWNRMTVRAGGRVDALSFVVNDRLGNFVPLTRPDDQFIVGYRRSASGFAVGPRTSVELRALSWLSVLGAYGEGYRSPQARLLDEGERAPFTRVRSVDLGVRIKRSTNAELTLGSNFTHLSDDVAFDAGEGRLERIGPTRRLGLTASTVLRPRPWLIAAASINVVDAALLEAPPATKEVPQPPFSQGQNLPFVAPITARADLGVHRSLVRDLLHHDLVMRAGAGFSFLSPRPLPGGAFAAPVALLDGSLGLGWSRFDLSFDAFNLLDNHYAAVEYNFASNWDPNAVRSRTATRHIAAGSPLSWMFTLGVQL
jgi:iron complex outermembrane recepter protein